MASRDSFIDNIDIPESQRRKVKERRRKDGFRGSGRSGGSSIRRETKAERQQRQRQERLKSLQSELSKTGSRLTPAEAQAVLSGESVANVRQRIVTRQRKEDLSSLQKELASTGERLSASEAQRILSGESVSKIRDTVFTRAQRAELAEQRQQERVEAQKAAAVKNLQERQLANDLLERQERAREEKTRTTKEVSGVISERPPASTLSERVRRAAQNTELLSSGVGSTAAGLVSGGIGVVEGTISAVLNPIQTTKQTFSAGKEFVTGGNPLPDPQLQNPRRGDFGFGVIAAETLAIAGTPSAVSAVRRTFSNPSVRTVTKGTTTTAKGRQTATTTGNVQSVSIADNNKFFLTDTSLRSIETLEDVPNTRITQTQSNIQQVSRKGKLKGEPSQAQSIAAERITENIDRTRTEGARLSVVDGKPISERTGSVSQRVTEDFTVGLQGATTSKGANQLSAQQARTLVRGELPITQRFDGFTVEKNVQGTVQEVRAFTVSGEQANIILDDLGNPKFVQQAKGNIPDDSGGSGTSRQSQELDVDTSTAQVNEQVTEAVKNLVTEQQGRTAGVAASPLSATPFLPENKESAVVVNEQPTQATRSQPSQTSQQLDELVGDSKQARPVSTRSDSLQALNVVSDQESGLSARSASNTRSLADTDLSSGTDSLTDTKPAQDTDQRQRPLTTSLPKASQDSRNRLLRGLNTRNALRPITPKVPVVPLPKARNTSSGQPLFRVLVGRKGNKIFQDLGTGGFDLVKQARKQVKNTAAATLQVQQLRGGIPQSRIQSVLGGSFSPSKTLQDAFVERKEERINTRGELTDITFAPRKTKGSLTSTDTNTDSALKLVNSGKSLRSVRELLR